MDVLLQTEMLPCGSGMGTLEFPTSSSSVLQGTKCMVGCENDEGEPSFPQSCDGEESVWEEDYCDDSSSRPVKKRRLSSSQVVSLERYFAVENRLEPERKFKLAKELGMQPRQVAIWFQNRRARFKSKQLEKDYDLLKASYDKFKADCDILSKQNEILRTEVLALKQKLPAKGRLELELFDVVNSSKARSVKSDVLESDSAYGTESSYVIEADQAACFTFSKDEVDKLLLLQTPLFPSSQLECFYDHPIASFGFTVEDQTLWSSLC